MKHLQKKFTYAGAKKGSKPPPPKPPVLKPPRVGNYKVGSSYQFSETVDLICQGPIDGLCNKYGERLDDSQLLQGVYLNDVPIEQSLSEIKTKVTEATYENGEGSILDILNTWQKTIRKKNKGVRQQATRIRSINATTNISGGKSSTTTKRVYNLDKNLLDATGFSWANSVPISYWTKYKLQSLYQGGVKATTDGGWYSYGEQRFTAGAPFTDFKYPSYTYAKFFLDKGPKRFQIDNSIVGRIMVDFGDGWSRADEVFRTWNTLWTKGECTFPTNYTESTCVEAYKENGETFRNQSVCRKGLNNIVEIIANKDSNSFEYEYLKKAFKNNGLNFKGGDLNSNNIYNQIRNKLGTEDSIGNELRGITGNGKQLFEPYIAFKFNGELENFSPIQALDFVNPSTGEILEREFNFELEESFAATYDWYIKDQNTVNLLIPQLDKDTGEWNGKVKGFYLSVLPTEKKSKTGILFKETLNSNAEVRVDGTLQAFGIKNEDLDFFKNTIGFGVFKMQRSSAATISKYNYLNVLAEFRNGAGPSSQEKLGFFNNVYLDRNIQKRLIGPFNIDPDRRMQALWNFDASGIYWYAGTQTPKQRSLVVSERNYRGTGQNVPSDNAAPAMAVNKDTGEEEWLIALSEGSSDKRPSNVKNVGETAFNFSDWNSFSESYNEKAQPITHIIYNPDVKSCYFTLNIEGLWDTLHHDESTTQSKIIGSKLPGIMNIRVEVGFVSPQGEGNKGSFEVVYDRFFRIVSLIEGGTGVDIGNPDNINQLLNLNYIKELYKDTGENNQESQFSGSIAEPFDLPDARYSEEYGYEEVYRERFIRITKLSTEGNSTLISKTANLAKVTEIIPRELNYPYSAICGVKLDSRSFGEIPKRSYDLRLKIVKIPSNYYPLNDSGRDKRFWDSAADLILAGDTKETRVYDGDWDGTFKYGWTDNPAWILYDILTDNTIGLGDQLLPENINKWQLYKIGRWCDAVDKNGYFEGVTNNILINGEEQGGRQPRYCCNTIFQRGIKIFDALNLIASNFRGLMYFSDSVVSFADDRIKEPIMLFNNSNVVEGIFNYSNLLKDQEYNAIEVAYNDKDDNFQAKIEYIENEKDIIERGLVKTRVDAFGVTSKSQARRHGEHLLFQATQENEQVSFSTGLEGILIRPGDLIIIEDELKTLTSNFGKVLNVDSENNTIRISSYFDQNNFEGEITVYIPTGSQQPEDIDDIVNLNRYRYEFFTLLQDVGNNLGGKNLDTIYSFDSYTEGFFDANVEKPLSLSDEYAYYTGNKNGTNCFLWYSTLYTGWIFSTGQSFTHNPTYDKYISASSGEAGSVISDFETYNDEALDINWYKFKTADDGRDLSESFTLSNSFLGLRETRGAVVDDDILINETKQIQNIKVLSGVQEDFGSLLYIDQTDEKSFLLPIIPKGSIYRFKTKNTTDRVYKVQTVKEDDTHSYEIIANAYKSGKFREIEETNFRDVNTYNAFYKEDEYKVDDSTYFTLQEPGNVNFTPTYITEPGGSQTVTILGTWKPVANATGYRVGVRNSFDQNYAYYDTPDTSLDYENITQNGQYRLFVSALGSIFDNNDYYKHYLDSERVFVNLNIDGLEEDDASLGTAIDGITIE